MTPEYETEIDSLIVELLDIIDSASQKQIAELDVEFKRAFARTHEKLEKLEEWKYCKYALVCWVDSEIIAQYPKWKEQPLEAFYFQDTKAFTYFYMKAKRCFEAKKFMNAYEVFFICFMFGFRGVYQPNYRTEIPADWPKTDAEWQIQAAKRLASVRKETTFDWGQTRTIDNQSKPLTGFGSLIGNLAVFLMLLITCIVFLVFIKK